MDSKENTLLRRYSVTYVKHPTVRGQVTRNNYYRHVRALISFPRLPETGGSPREKWVRRLIIRSVTRSLIFFVLVRVTGLTSRRRRYVFRKRNYELYVQTWHAGYTTSFCTRCSLFARESASFTSFEASCVSVSRRKFNFRRYCPHLTTMTKSSSVNRWLDCIVPLQRDIKGGENGNARFRSLISVEACN